VTVIRADQLVEIEFDATQRAAALRRCAHGVRFDWFGRTVEVRCDRPFEIEALRKRYRAFLTSDEPDLTSCAFGGDGAPVFFTQPGEAFRHPLELAFPGALAFLADAVTTRAFFQVHPTLCSFHAAALRIGDAAAAISAISTGGKSTTAFACARRGMALYSDERCVIQDGMVLPFPRAVNLRAGGIELLLGDEVPGDGGIAQRLRSHRGHDWEAAQLDEVIGAHAPPAPARLEAIFFITGRAQRPHAELLERESALRLLLEASFVGPPPGMDRLAAAARLLQQTRAFGLTLGTPDATALLLAATTVDAPLLSTMETA
jgi:hypothetical protein